MPPNVGVEVPARRPRRRRRGVGRVDHDVDPDRRLLRLDELRQPEPVGRVRRQQVHGRVREARRGDELLRVASGRRACTGPSSRRTRRCSPAGSGCSSAGTRPPKTTLFSVLRSIASSNACRSFALDASGVPTFVYGRLPTPFLLPMLMTMPVPAELVAPGAPAGSRSAGRRRAPSARPGRAPGCRPPSAPPPRRPRRASA